MNEMNYDDRNYRYDDRDYRYDDRNYRDERNYRYDERDYRRDYDRRGGKINNRNYRMYRNYREDYREELQMITEDMREHYRQLEDVAEIADNPQDKNAIMRIAQKEKENYNYLRQIAEK